MSAHSSSKAPSLGTTPQPRRPHTQVTLLAATALTLLAGCATQSPAMQPAPTLPATWQAARPAVPAAQPAGNPAAHGASQGELQTWWAQFDDPALTRLQSAAQENNGSVVQAAARIEQARAGLRSAGAVNAPQLNAAGGASRGLQSGAPQIGNSATIGLDTLWEIDLFGAGRANRSAALAQLEGSQAAWHDARVSLAAEVAQTYVNLRACEQTAAVLQQDARSQQTSASLTERKVQAGLEAPANGALVRASAADSALRLTAQQAQCEVLIKSLVSLTALPEAEVRGVLAPRTATLPTPRAFSVDALPAQWLTQRPDLRAIERDAAAALRDVDAAKADRWPRLSLVGSVSRLRVESGGATALSTPWSIGPSLSLPIFDAGRRSAAVDAAQARYAEARSRYEQRARDAVREVEEALVRLDAAQRREADAITAAQGFATFLEAQRKRTDAGAGSLLDLEEARRTALNAQSSLIAVQAERVSAWITLYRAVGGGWSVDLPPSTAGTPRTLATAPTATR